MQHVKLDLDHYEMYCPVTGEHIIGQERTFTPSKATLFCFVGEVSEFEFANPKIKELFEVCEKKYESECDTPFDMMIRELNTDETYKNCILFSIATSSLDCNSNEVYYLFDMNLAN